MSKKDNLQTVNTQPYDNSASENDIALLINQLSDPDGSKRQHARRALITIGTPAVQELILALSKPDDHMRWEAVKALHDIGDITAAPALVELLGDDNTGVRWAASEALIALDQAVVPHILKALLECFDCAQLREGAHHVLHVFKDRRHLLPPFIRVFEALEGIEPDVEVPWAINHAMEELHLSIKS